MKYEFSEAQKRETAAQRRLGGEAGTGRRRVCHICGEARPRSLMRKNGRVICYECQARIEGRKPTEAHHVMGKSNDPCLTVEVPANDHQQLTDRWEDAPPETRENPYGSPLRKASGAIRCWLDILWVIIHQAVGWVPEFLEWLDDELNSRIGFDWYLQWEWKPA
jgi:uncharacterized Zn finger protein (UPF0148 family)